MLLKPFVTLLTLFALSGLAEAQQLRKVPTLGYLSSGSGLGPSGDAFNEGLSALGYVEGKNIHIERRFAGGKLDRLPELAAGLIALKVEVIVSADGAATAAAVKATTSVPIVMAISSDPVGSGYIDRKSTR